MIDFIYQISSENNMIVGIVDEKFDEEFLEVNLESDEKEIKSSPLQEITKENFVKVMNSESSESNTTTNTTIGNLLSLNLSDTT